MDHFHGNPMPVPPPTDNLSSDVAEAMDAAAAAHQHGRPSYTHMTLYWGKDSEILFAGWPGTSAAMYALAALLVFLMAGLVEWLAHRGAGAGVDKGVSSPRAAAAHTLRVAVVYVIMLAVMSFNVGILVAAVAGHALGYIWFADPPTSRGFEEREVELAGPPARAC